MYPTCAVALCPPGPRPPCTPGWCSGCWRDLTDGDSPLRRSPSPLPDSLPRPLLHSTTFPATLLSFVSISPSLLSAGAATHFTCASPTSLHRLASDPTAPHCTVRKLQLAHFTQPASGSGLWTRGLLTHRLSSSSQIQHRKVVIIPIFQMRGNTSGQRSPALSCCSSARVCDHHTVSPREDAKKRGRLLTATSYRVHPGLISILHLPRSPHVAETTQWPLQP